MSAACLSEINLGVVTAGRCLRRRRISGYSEMINRLGGYSFGGEAAMALQLFSSNQYVRNVAGDWLGFLFA